MTLSCQRYFKGTVQNSTRTQKRRQSVVADRQQLYFAAQSRSPNHRQTQTTTEKVQSSARDGAFLTDDGRLFHARAEATGKARSPSVTTSGGRYLSPQVSDNFVFQICCDEDGRVYWRIQFLIYDDTTPIIQ